MTNKWGLEVSEATASQVKRSEGMKQGKLDAFFGRPAAAAAADKRKKADKEDDPELQRALEISKQEYKAKEEEEEAKVINNAAHFAQVHFIFFRGYSLT